MEKTVPKKDAAWRSVAGIAIDGERLFVAKRKPGGSLGEKWEFPGGKAEPGESDEDALKREYAEEFGVSVNVGSLLASAGFSSKGRIFMLNAYEVSFVSFDFTLAEHTKWRWASIGEIESDSCFSGCFADSDLLLLPGLRKHLSAK